MQVLQDHCRYSPKMHFPVMQHFLLLQVADALKEAAVKKTPKKEKAAKPASASPKVKRAKNAFMFFSADKRAALKGKRNVDHTTGNSPESQCMAACSEIVLLSRSKLMTGYLIEQGSQMLCENCDVHCLRNRCPAAEQNPHLTMGETSKKLGELWKEISGEEKAKYKVSCSSQDIPARPRIRAAHPCV